ncbi:hypothetical protein [Streptomyces pseudovenezuelae]|uniref:CopC domain-containing protein n=1 Tax=Streptomyces pseudovenezuelae TaxID=67350 RepID=A0ABT6LKJ1_9ACTN|nr:hypothetical protein [Streptomyces pseudovenezuelae]MDH6216811.1 hypothetical protein [Streptomyces pseudovenezuelae]
MPTTSLPCRPGARTAALAALTLAVGALTVPAVGAVPMAPGDNGTVKIHSSDPRTPVGDPRDEPKVCGFYIDATGFDANQSITWSIETQPLVQGGATSGGAIVLPQGAGHTTDQMLPDGQYKLTWSIVGGNGAGKQKVFKVDCGTTPPTSPPPTTPPPTNPPGGPGGPHGGPPAGGGGLARDAALGPVAGAAAVGLAAVVGTVWFRLRRRPHGAA